MPRDTEVEQGLENLSAIKQGKNPTDPISQPETDEKGALEVAQDEVDRLFEEHDLDQHIDRSHIHIGVARWSRRHGICKYRRKLPKQRFGERMTSLPKATGHHSIIMNEKVFEQSDMDDYLDVVRHELAHAMAYAKHGSTQGHNSKWKRMAATLGADTSATHHRRDRSDEYEYYIHCPECGYEGGKTKRSKVIQTPFNRKCGKCGASNMSSYEEGQSPPKEHGVVKVESIPWDNKNEWLKNDQKL